MKIENNRYMRVFWTLYPMVDCDFNALMLICYIIYVYGALNESITIEGIEYKRLSDSFIQERLDMSSPTIRKCLKLLEEKEMIKVYVGRGKEKGSVRYVNLMVEVISANTDETIDENISESISENIFKKINKYNKYKNIKEGNIFNSESKEVDSNVSSLIF